MHKSAEIEKRVPMEIIGTTLNTPKAKFTAEIADNEASRRKGLGKRASLPEGAGMFFDIPGPFWMKDVSFPIDLVSLTKEGAITEIQTMYPDLLPDIMKPLYRATDVKSAYAVELPAGWCKGRGVQPGDTVRVATQTKEAQLGRFINPILDKMFKYRRGFFGRDIANLARNRGVRTTALDPDHIPGSGGLRLETIHETLRNLIKNKVKDPGRKTQLLKAVDKTPAAYSTVGAAGRGGFKGVVVNPAGLAVPSGGAQRRAYTVVNPRPKGAPKDLNKLQEYEILSKYAPGTMPKTIAISEILKKHNLHKLDPKNKGFVKKMRDAIEAELGPRFILKDRAGAASIGLPTETTPLNRIFYNLSMNRNRAALNKLIAMERIPMKGMSRFDRFLEDYVTKPLLGKGTYQSLQHFHPSNRGREYRVHVMGGKVVPYATQNRGSVTGVITPGGLLHPFEERRVNKFVQQTFDKLPRKHKQSYGLDVGIGRDGKPFIIETNPAALSGASGLLENPPIISAITAATKGRLPGWIKARNTALAGGAAVPVTYGATRAAGPEQT